jgi:hypothetical protein
MWSSRVRWKVGTTVVVSAMFLPVALDRDSFPLSTYPMYSRARPSEVSFVTAVGVGATGDVQRLSLALIGDSDDPLIVAGELRTAVADGRAGQRCAAIAGRVGARQSGDSDMPDRTVAVEVVTERHDVIAQVTGRPSQTDRVVHARCDIDGS